MSDSLGKKQHFVMRAHLDKFILPPSHPMASERRFRVLFPYKRGEGQIYPHGEGPKGLAWAYGFYDKTSGPDKNFIDAGLQKVEPGIFSRSKGKMSPICRCVYEDGYFPRSGYDLAMIAYCVAVTWLRSPVVIHTIAMHDGFLNNVKALYIANESGINVEVKIKHEKQNGLMALKYPKILAPVFAEMRWRILTPPRNQYFLTSDNPVVIYDQTTSKRRFVQIGQSKDVEIWFPLSFNTGLYLDWKAGGVLSGNENGNRFAIGRSKTRELNRHIIRRCYKHVYSPLAEEWIEDAIIENKFSPMLGKFTTFEDCMSLEEINELKDLQNLKDMDFLPHLERIEQPYDIFAAMGMEMH